MLHELGDSCEQAMPAAAMLFSPMTDQGVDRKR
jgi:hypothetical protein